MEVLIIYAALLGWVSRRIQHEQQSGTAVGFSSDWNWCGFKFQCCCVSYIDPSGCLFNQVSYIYSLHSSSCALKIHLVNYWCIVFCQGSQHAVCFVFLKKGSSIIWRRIWMLQENNGICFNNSRWQIPKKSVAKFLCKCLSAHTAKWTLFFHQTSHQTKQLHVILACLKTMLAIQAKKRFLISSKKTRFTTQLK